MEYEKCYSFEPEDLRPAKRRKTEAKGLQASWPLRRKAYQTAWQDRKGQIDSTLDQLNKFAVDNIAEFLDEAAHQQGKQGISTAILSIGPEASSYSAMVEQLIRRQAREKVRILISISPADAANLKSLLKSVIQKSTAQQDGEDDEDDRLRVSRTGRKLLNYDLDLLARYVKLGKIEQVGIAIEGTETFDGDLLSEIIELFSFWLDRIPFVLLLGVATSVNTLQQRLSRAAVRCLDGQLFDVAEPQLQMERALHALIENTPPIWPGAELMSLALERQQDYIQSIDGFIRAAQYAYMSHYYANALSIFLMPDINFGNIPRDHFEALRKLDSFRQHCNGLLEDGRTERARALLDDSHALFILKASKQ